MVHWSRPPPGVFALNIDGSSKDNPAAGGGVIRNDQGDFIAAFYAYFGAGSNNAAETRSLFMGLLLCGELGISRVQIQTDSLLVANWFSGVYEKPWSLKPWWDRIGELVEGKEVNIKHIFREANSIADLLAAKARIGKHSGMYGSSYPARIKAIIHLEKEGIPYIRFRSS